MINYIDIIGNLLVEIYVYEDVQNYIDIIGTLLGEIYVYGDVQIGTWIQSVKEKDIDYIR